MKVAWQTFHSAEKEDWGRLRQLELQLERGELLELTDELRALLRRVAQQVAFTPEEAERGLRSPAEAAALVMRMSRRTLESAERLGRAMLDAAALSGLHDTWNARRVLKAALEHEVVPYYRQSLEALLHSLENPRN
jgi:DUSAM domain-containing protein